MSSRKKVIDILNDQGNSRINFSFYSSPTLALGRRTRVTVNGTTFQRVASAITRNRVNVAHISEAPSRQFRMGAGYLNRNNTIYLPHIRSEESKAGVIHEAVHASFDLTYTSRFDVPKEDNESACYIAEHLYRILNGHSLSPSRENIHNMAHRNATVIISRGRVNRRLLQQLRDAIRYSFIHGDTSQDFYHGDG